MESLAPPVRVIRINKPVSVNTISETQFIYDFGENAAALPQITVQGKRGDSIQLNHAEFIHADGILDPTSENNAKCEDIYILRGGEAETYRPRFTWHGYRYMMLTRSSPDILIHQVQSCVIHSDVAVSGSFRCSRNDLNQLHEAFVRTELACLQGVPLDCPQRDERVPWLGDAHATSLMCLYNFDMRDLYKSFLEDMKTGRNPTTGVVQFISPSPATGRSSIDWNMAYPIILNEYYERYGDKGLLRDHYASLREHTGYYISIAENGLIPPCWFGDWFSLDMPEGLHKVAFEAGPDNHRQNPPYCASLFYHQTLRLTAEIAEILGERTDADSYRAQMEITRNALLASYYHSDTGIFGSGGQFMLTYALAERLIPEKHRKRVFNHLLQAFRKQDGHSVMGVIGTRLIFDLFIDSGMPEKAYALLTQEGYPGFLNLLSGGRTTLTEGLDGSGSGCHCMFTSPDTAFYRLKRNASSRLPEFSILLMKARTLSSVSLVLT